MTNIKEIIKSDREKIFTQLSELVKFNSVHTFAELKDQMDGAKCWVSKALTEAGLEVEEHVTEDGSVTLLGQRAGKEGAKTVLLYSHYDVVPAGDEAKWDSDPFTLTERNGRWYARGAADCKGNVVMHLAALRALEQTGDTDLNIKVLIEGSEEMGGAGLSKLIAKTPEAFAADAILIADCGNWAVGEPTLTSSLRGSAMIRVQMDTLSSPAHSGQFGGAAPDAVKALMRALDSLYDDTGATVIEGTDSTAKWEGRSYPAEEFRKDARLLEGTEIAGDDNTDAGDLVWARPSVTVTGFTSTPVDRAVNAVPATAEAMLNVRVPAAVNPQEIAEAVVAHLKAHTPFGAHFTADIIEAARGFETDLEKPALKILEKALSESYGKETTTMGMGGSIPLTVELQDAHPDAEIALFGVEEPQCAIHSPNESVDPSEIEHIAIAEALFLQTYK
ncbi:MAG: dipeptidase [Corynebacterium casei]|uniref:dipeptidase n=1 Tax=Corynebacterium casei TaxID=160386 RepID=UPI0026472BB8|nr:dipeptidase [Corynebacterium casei]MDN5903676.1 dipeptidase [Corynebacterium casei]MDN6627452.1 dipeptidase [Corynebacterium casei]MDN6672903.1 dipeptidase [Corynebacterium casei]MDN6693639.1 dipeptidase [Corynebacterium casei]MDN6738558.1 dipeptidase [Corynebacterium casei]